MGVGRREYRGQQGQRSGGGRFRRKNPNSKPNPADARQKIRKNLIVKSEPVSNQVQIYTTHFDARNKINAKKGISSQSRGRGGRAQAQGRRTSQGVARKALDDVRKGTKQISAKKRNGNFNNNNNNNNNKTPVKNAKRFNNYTATGIRESTFTGKSIKISTTNDLVPKERKALVKGKSLSIVAKNRTNRTNKQLHKTINNTWIGPNTSHTHSSRQQSASPEPIAIATSSSSSSKRSIPAKVVISNLHPNVTQEDILELFGAIGTLRDGHLKSVGTAEVIYRVAEDAFAAYSKYHGRNLDGQPMILKITTAEESGASSMMPSSRNNKYSSSSMTSSAPTCYSAPVLSSNNAAASTPVVFTVKL